MRRCTMTGAHYEVLAAIIKTLPDNQRDAVARHFAHEFNKRSPAFDAGAWFDRISSRTDNSDAARAARVAMYLKQQEAS